MDRRSFVKYATVGAVATASPAFLAAAVSAESSPAETAAAEGAPPAVESAPLAPQSAAVAPRAAAVGTGGTPVRQYSGTDLSGWEQALGDGWAAPGQSKAKIKEIESNHNGSETELRANIKQRRGVMAHNINFKRVIDATALSHVHVGAFEFRLPYLPAQDAWPDNAQTIEGGLFVWDGGDTRRDYGLAFQWVLNPWMTNFGEIQTWVPADGGSWGSSTTLTPDQIWHRVEFTLDMENSAASMTLDGIGVPASFVAEEKEESWGTETAARLQAEIISLWPGTKGSAPSHRAEFRNWTWDWFSPSGQ